MLERRVAHRARLLWIPALCNTLFGVLLTYTSAPWLEVLPFEFPGIRPREVAVVTSLIRTCSGPGNGNGRLKAVTHGRRRSHGGLRTNLSSLDLFQYFAYYRIIEINNVWCLQVATQERSSRPAELCAKKT